LTGQEVSVECAPRLRQGLNQPLFNKLNQAIRVGACAVRLMDRQDYQQDK